MIRQIQVLSFFLILCLVCFSHPVLAQTTGAPEFWSKDRKAHAAVSAILSPVVYISMRNMKFDRADSFFGSFFLVTILGVVKEINDNPLEEDDMAANAAGAFVGSLVSVTIDF